MTRRRRQMLVVVVMFVALVAATARPAAAASCTVSGSVLTITGTSTVDAVTITDSGTAVTLTVTGCAVAAANYTTVNITLLGGADTVSYTLTAGFAGGARQRNLVVQLGGGGTSTGAQTFTFSQGSQVINTSSSISLLVVGGSGVDQITVDLNAEIDSSSVNVVEVLGAGVDTSTVTISHVGSAATVDVDVDLGEGNNTSTLTVVDVHFDATVNFNLTGGTRIDTATLNMNGDLAADGNLYYTARLNAGADTFTGTLGAAFDLTQGEVRIEVEGGAGADILNLSDVGAGVIDGSDSILDVRFDGGLGVDDSTVSLTNVDIQPGDFVHGLRLRVNGGGGIDDIDVVVTDLVDTTAGNYDMAIRGDDGDDTIDLAFTRPVTGTATFGPDGRILLDGGLGDSDAVNGTGTGGTFRIINNP